jgi:threonine dehydrogenase-like Zn-dependent dehydrogenase
MIMKAIAVVPGTKELHMVDRSEPMITSDNEIKMHVLEVGICGTDRDEATGGRALAQEGQADLVIGHEMFGKVTETGKSVTRVSPGDYAVFTVRRNCGHCLSCMMNRSDMCSTGEYKERGIKGLDGYETEYVVDTEQYVVHIPSQIKAIGVLTEPMSVAEKAIDEAVNVQLNRLPDSHATSKWLHGRRCLVAGLGPIGLLAALALRLRGAEVFGIDVVDTETSRPQWLAGIGGRYLDGRQIKAEDVKKKLGQVDLIFEATGVASLEFNLLDALGQNGVYVLTGIPAGDRPLQIQGSELIRRLVLGNQVMIGSVNASRDHFQMAIDDLQHAWLQWRDHVEKLISHRYPYTDFLAAFQHHSQDEIKVVLEWNQ